MLESLTGRIGDGSPMLAYGIAVTDVDGDGHDEFFVCGFAGPNRVLAWRNGGVVDITPAALADAGHRSIGVAAADVDGDGREEIYVLNTDTFSGRKRIADRLWVRRDGDWIDAFELAANAESLNLTAGRSVCAIDRRGSGTYAIVVANYGGALRCYEVDEALRVTDVAESVGIGVPAGGRSLVAGPIVTDRTDLFCGNENGANFLFANVSGTFDDVAFAWGVADPFEHARGAALIDLGGATGLVCSNWEGPHRFWVPGGQGGFEDHASPDFAKASPARTLIVADFDNDGREEVFINNMGEPNRLFVISEGRLEPVSIGDAAEAEGLGTGAAVADIDGDGCLELLIAHGESQLQPLTMYSAKAASRGNHWIRVRPITNVGAPARGTVVEVERGNLRWRRVIDGGSGYLCQMEPVAHVGLGPDGSPIERVTVRWPDGWTRELTAVAVDQELTLPRAH
jgi:hypothetical protein